LQGVERGEVGLASYSVIIHHLNSAIFLFVTDHPPPHTHPHMWGSRNVKLMKAVRTQKIETFNQSFSTCQWNEKKDTSPNPNGSRRGGKLSK